MMNDFGGSFNLMGDIFGEEFAMEAPKAKKETAKKETAKKEAKKTSSKAKKVFVNVPCTVYGGNFVTKIEKQGKDKVSIDDLADLLCEAGYVEAKAKTRQFLVNKTDESIVYLTSDKFATATADDVAADFSAGDVTFAYGGEQILLKAEEFEQDADEICMADLKAKIAESFPQFKSCDFYYDVESAVVVPILKTADEKTKVSFPAVFVVNGEERVLDEDGIGGTTLKDAADSLTKDFISEGLKAGFGELDSKYYLVLWAVSPSSAASASADKKKNKGASAKKVEKKYPSNVTVYLSFNGYRETLSAEKFEGKEKITLADILEYLKPRFKILESEEKRKGIQVFSYDEATNQISLIVSEGRRGAASTALADECVESGLELDSIMRKVPVTAYGKRILCGATHPEWYKSYVFATYGKAFIYDRCGGVTTLKAFRLKTPRVPARIKREMIQYFRSQMPNEAIVKVTYNHGTGEFELLKPRVAHADHVSIESEFDLPKDPNTEIIATFHSHNSMPAFFSATDDEAELDQIGVFGVIGRLDGEQPQIIVRAVYEGGVKRLSHDEFFGA
jgi:PRTRC genetic system protein A